MAIRNGGGSARNGGGGAGIAAGQGYYWCTSSHEAPEEDMTFGPGSDRLFAATICLPGGYGIGCVNGQGYWDCTGRSKDERASFGS